MSKAIHELKPVRKIRSIQLGFENSPISNVTLISNCQFFDTRKFNSAIVLTSTHKLFGDTKEYLTAPTREILIVLEDGSKALIMPIDPHVI